MSLLQKFCYSVFYQTSWKHLISKLHFLVVRNNSWIFSQESGKALNPQIPPFGIMNQLDLQLKPVTDFSYKAFITFNIIGYHALKSSQRKIRFVIKSLFRDRNMSSSHPHLYSPVRVARPSTWPQEFWNLDQEWTR